MLTLFGRRFYYGWVIVACTLLINLATIPINPALIAFFVSPITEDLGWTRGELSIGIMIRLAAAGLSAPIFGPYLDKYGARWLGACAGLCAGLSVMSFALVHDLWTFYILSALAGFSGLGGPAGHMLTTVPISKWFEARRGRALGIATLGLPLGGMVAFLVIERLIDALGWRTTFVYCGIFSIVLSVPLSILFMRKDPESMGLNVDGLPGTPRQANAALAANPAVDTSNNWTTAEAVRTRIMWALILSMTLISFIQGAINFYRVAFWEDIGISRATIAATTSLDPLLVATSILFFGILAEKLKPRYIGFLAGSVLAISMLPMIFARNTLIMPVFFNSFYGIGMGLTMTTMNVIWPGYFGRRFVGAIRGFVFPFLVVASAAAAPLFSTLFARVGDDRLVWIVAFAAFAISAMLVLTTRPPTRQPAPAPVGELVTTTNVNVIRN